MISVTQILPTHQSSLSLKWIWTNQTTTKIAENVSRLSNSKDSDKSTRRSNENKIGFNGCDFFCWISSHLKSSFLFVCYSDTKHFGRQMLACSMKLVPLDQSNVMGRHAPSLKDQEFPVRQISKSATKTMVLWFLHSSPLIPWFRGYSAALWLISMSCPGSLFCGSVVIPWLCQFMALGLL